MSVLKIPTNFNIELEFKAPEFYKRLLSLFIDMFIQFIYIKVANAIYSEIHPGYDDDPLQGLQMILFLPVMLYHIICEATMNGQSFGKKIMGIRVVDEFGGRASISQLLIRWLLRLSDLWIILVIILLLIIITQNGMRGADMETIFSVVLAFIFLITDIILVVSSKKSQRIGDILAKTIIISTRTKGDINETVFQEVADNYVPSFPQIMQLSDRDINAMKSILESARKRGDYNMAEDAAAKIKRHLNIETSMGPFDFLEVLLKDYNYLSIK